jgi:hypothetical protein
MIRGFEVHLSEKECVSWAWWHRPVIVTQEIEPGGAPVLRQPRLHSKIRRQCLNKRKQMFKTQYFT